LSWSVAGASAVIISGIGPVDISGSATVNPQETTIYTLLAIGLDKGTVTQKLTVIVDRSSSCIGLVISGSTGSANKMQVKVGPNINDYYSAKNVIVEVRLFDNNNLIEIQVGVIPEIPPHGYGVATILFRKARQQDRNEYNIIGCSCDFTRPK
jgi:hypothetical protein